MRVEELAAFLKAELHGPGDAELRGVGPIASAKAGDVTFVTSAEYEQFLSTTGATAVIVARRHNDLRMPQIVHRNPYWCFAKAMQIFYKAPKPTPGVRPGAVVEPGATVDPSAAVYPFAYVAAGARIGKDVILHPGVYVGPN